MFYRSIIFTEAPLMKAYRYRDKFQLVPIFYMPTAPISIYASHIPCILEYQVEDIEEKLPTESMLREKGLSEETLKLGRKIPTKREEEKKYYIYYHHLPISISSNISVVRTAGVFNYLWRK